METYTIIDAFSEVVVFCRLCSVLGYCRFEEMLMFELLCPLNYKLTKFDSLSSGVDKHKNLLACSKVTKYQIITFFIVNIPHSSFSRDIVAWVFRIFYSHEVDQKRHRSETGIKVEQACLSGYSQKISYIDIVRQSST